jgi:hypothetical protein
MYLINFGISDKLAYSEPTRSPKFRSKESFHFFGWGLLNRLVISKTVQNSHIEDAKECKID